MRISHSSIKNYLKYLGLFSNKSIKKPKLTTQHIKARFNASKDWLMMTENEIKSIVFSDESKFNLKYSDSKVHVWKKPQEGLNIKNVAQTVKFGGGSIMVWGCFSYNGVEKFHFIEETMDAAYYCNLLSSNLQDSCLKMGLNDYIFMQDNDLNHTSKLAKGFFKEME